MGPACARLIDELGYDPDDGVPELADVGELRARGLGRSLPRGAMIAARVAGQRVAVARLGGGRISDGFVDGERLVCARHGWELEARDGRCERACKLRE